MELLIAGCIFAAIVFTGIIMEMVGYARAVKDMEQAEGKAKNWIKG